MSFKGCISTETLHFDMTHQVTMTLKSKLKVLFLHFLPILFYILCWIWHTMFGTFYCSNIAYHFMIIVFIINSKLSVLRIFFNKHTNTFINNFLSISLFLIYFTLASITVRILYSKWAYFFVI